MTFYIAPLVEGQTEEHCLEPLLWRIWNELLQSPERLQVLKPFRVHRDSLVQSDGLPLAESIEKTLILLRAKMRKEAAAKSLLLIFLDAESDCPAELGPRLRRSAQTARPDANLACVLAKRMFENWIVAGADTLAGENGLPDQLELPAQPEECSGVHWLEKQLRSQRARRSYKKTVDAEAFVQKMNLLRCRETAPSFDKLCRELEKFLSR